MKHKCQSSLVRCALRGQHPRYVLYRWNAVWMLLAPVNGHLVATFPGTYSLNLVNDLARRGLPRNREDRSVESEVPC